MSAIFGAVGRQHKLSQYRPEWLFEALDSVRYRGPDGMGLLLRGHPADKESSPHALHMTASVSAEEAQKQALRYLGENLSGASVLLMHRRLSIIDVSDSAYQ